MSTSRPGIIGPPTRISKDAGGMMRPPGASRRVLALLVDGAIIVACDSTLWAAVADQLEVLAIIAYAAGFWTFVGSTPGQYLFRIRVVTTGGTALNPFQSLIRALALIATLPVAPISLWMAHRDATVAQSLADHIAGSRVVMLDREAPWPQRIGGPAMESQLAFIGGGAVFALVALAAMNLASAPRISQSSAPASASAPAATADAARAGLRAALAMCTGSTQLFDDSCPFRSAAQSLPDGDYGSIKWTLPADAASSAAITITNRSSSEAVASGHLTATLDAVEGGGSPVRHSFGLSYRANLSLGAGGWTVMSWSAA